MDWIRKKISEKKKPQLNDDLETLTERSERWRSIYVIYFTMFLMSLGFSIVLTGVWPYLDKLDPTAGKEFMGYVVAANPLGQMLFSPVVGWWGNKRGSVRLPLLITLALFVIASGIYSTLEIIPGDKKTWMIAGRFLVGVSSANIAVARSYLSAATRLSERTQAVSMVSLAQVLGFVVGPGLQSAVTPLGNDGFILFGLPFNMYTMAGWINVFMGILNFFLFLPWNFVERKIAAREAMRDQGKSSEKETWKAMKPDYLVVWTLICAFFILVFNFVLLETLGTPLTMDQFAWTKKESLYYIGLLLSIGAIIACVMFIIIGPLCRKFAERKIMIWVGFFFMLIGRIVCIPWGTDTPLIAEKNDIINGTTFLNGTEIVGCPSDQEWCRYTPRMTVLQFVIGYGFTTIGYPVGVTLVQTIFSKILGPRPQGVWMGLMTGAGCASRVLGPVFMGLIYTRLGTYHTFGITGVTLIIAMIWLQIMDERLVPKVTEKVVKDQNLINNSEVENYTSDKVNVETPFLIDSNKNGSVKDIEMQILNKDSINHDKNSEPN
ncbi:major facilitator superfamily domain-containing protein 8 [Chelonus insularis]|uniref:major facilitator superfamily domain-containing protein 8 n=1 Tax=Chelonus insularis TaxID=460826 RepID=UPI00158C2B70|nr:major facilitator superfamily domain-containing protein 8 [Chelonus insularis]XP_034949229.1 major facilitator superfamily domain-containing protein 8 [Chelonus insularis]XP_034949230.1 major facilitator superfamily domain-containing protein 8 [Chelonus insularis]XP_034949231.1 major facilitator superfamily domain-containing protein 8 [Chelonus insularis]XP_034949232.1 major facilitator superfamily domain-containing protein 8 [Chelonus insularis]XP_034949233.1 major facilitator superfamily 